MDKNRLIFRQSVDREIYKQIEENDFVQEIEKIIYNKLEDKLNENNMILRSELMEKNQSNIF